MNTTLMTARDHHDHPPQPQGDGERTDYERRRVGHIDRVALHVGVALVTWSRRPRRASTVQSRAAQSERELQLARIAQARASGEQSYPRMIIR